MLLLSRLSKTAASDLDIARACVCEDVGLITGQPSTEVTTKQAVGKKTDLQGSDMIQLLPFLR